MKYRGRARCFFFLDDVYPAGGNIGGDTYPRNEQQTLVVHAHREGRIRDAHSLDQQYKRSMALFPLIMLVAVLHDPKKLGSEMRENRKTPPPVGTLNVMVGCRHCTIERCVLAQFTLST